LPGSPVEGLDVADVGMGVTGVTSLAKAISSMAALAHLAVGKSDFGSEGGTALVEAIKNSNLVCSSCSASHRGACQRLPGCAGPQVNRARGPHKFTRHIPRTEILDSEWGAALGARVNSTRVSQAAAVPFVYIQSSSRNWNEYSFASRR
jgi:hypothetical protein